MVPEPHSASIHALQGVARKVTPKEAWVLAPLIAGQPTYRTGRWIGTRFQYPRPKTLPRITAALPTRPAAVMVHGTDYVEQGLKRYQERAAISDHRVLKKLACKHGFQLVPAAVASS